MKKSQTQRPPQTKWIEVPESLKLGVPFVMATPLRPIGNDAVLYQVQTEKGAIKIQIPNNSSFDMSNGQIFDDMCNMDILNEPEILNNLVARYKKDKIFTFIGPTLIAVNPYRVIPQYFSKQNVTRIRDKILNGTTNTQQPHIFLIAGNAYTSMIDQQKKQAIVISGESGAGKTQSTKYCMQILTSLSHNQTLPIQNKILACNPILQAFGNSKTTRNDNSSRFGKYVQIYFSGNNTIVGASINSYLLEKSRVVAAAEKERSYHVFYALIASEKFGLKKPEYYNYLSKSKCYDAKGVNDKQYFSQIKSSMDSIGFTANEQNKIWELLGSILQLGNIQFDDSVHKENESNPCQIKNKKEMQKIAATLGVSEGDLEKILLFEKKKFLKDITFSPYNKVKSIANINTLSKAIYNAIFQFVLYKIQKSLKPQQNKDYLSINILDIFGFENFDINSFEQFCINFTNEKLLKLYNKYVFEKEMQILRQDGLYEQVASIKPPTNDAVIQMISGKLSLFSLINDMTMPQQFKDSDIIQSFQAKLSNSPFLKFDKLSKTKFIINHSQCSVKYDVEGFKEKNQDKVLQDILNIVTNLFEHESKEQSGKTLLNKFGTQMEQLMSQLNSSCVHFIRCIKPNQKKVPNLTELNYMIQQVRYLGVFETIQIRKKTFPSRWLYQQFIQRFQNIFPGTKGNSQAKCQKIVKQLTNNTKQYLLGNKRIYMSPELEAKLSKKLHEFMKKKIDAAKKILKFYRKSKFKKQIFIKLKVLAKRIRIWKKFAATQAVKLQKQPFERIKQYVNYKKEQQKIQKNKKLMQAKQKREQEEKKMKQLNQAKKRQNLAKYSQVINKYYTKFLKKKVVDKLKSNLEKSKSKKAEPTFSSAQTNISGSNNKIQAKYATKKIESSYASNNNNNMNDSMLNQSIIVEDNRQPYKREQFDKKQNEQKDYQFNESFLDEKSILVTNDKQIVFEGTLLIPMYKNKDSEALKKLRQILSEKYEVKYDESEEDFFSPASDDANFKIQETDQQILKSIINFQSREFFKQVLRKRTNFFGMQKDQDDILVCKPKPLSKSLSLIDEDDEKEAIKVFKSLLKISQQAKLENVFKLIQHMISLCQGTSPQLKNEVFLQLLKQCNTDLELPSVRILQTLAVFLHIFSPDKNFLIAGLNFFFKKLAQQRFSQKQTEYVRYNFKKLLRKLERASPINYMPIKYQMMALMCKRKISLPVYLPIGSSVIVRVESYETFSDIKQRVMKELGLDSQRLNPDLFGFFEIVNFDNQELQQTPIQESVVVWDTITYWQKAKEKYKQKGIVPPVFFLMLKIKYTFECHYSDEQVVQIMFGQAYFQYFIGRLQLPLQDLSALAACIKKIKFSSTHPDDYKASYPAWATKKFSEKDMITKMKKNVSQIQKQKLNEYDIKFKFLSCAQKSPLCMSLAVGTDQNVKVYLKPKKLFITDKNEIVDQIAVKSIVKFAEDGEKFVYLLRGSSQTKIVYTEHASLICNYLSTLPGLVKKSNSRRDHNILGDLA